MPSSCATTPTLIRARIAAEPFSTYPVCDGDIDHVVGYVDAKDLFQRVLNNQPISLADDSLVRKVLIVPDRLTLAEVLEQFRQVHEDFAVIVNEYSLVVGVVTLNDVMSTVMGDLVGPADEEQIVRRDENSWLIDGTAPIEDVLHVLGLDELPHAGDYETLAGFLMVMLRRVPRRTDSVTGAATSSRCWTWTATASTRSWSRGWSAAAPAANAKLQAAAARS